MARRVLAGWSWEEDWDEQRRGHLAGRIVAELDARLGACPGRRFYAVTGHPRLPPALRAALDGMARDGRDLRRVPREKRSDAYVTKDPAVLGRTLPAVFVLGPPKIAVLAFVKDAVAAWGGMAAAISALVQRPLGPIAGTVCMDFDSGDLLRIT